MSGDPPDQFLDARELGAATRDVRLVALTGYGLADDRARALAAGFDRHMTKPVDPQQLQELVNTL